MFWVYTPRSQKSVATKSDMMSRLCKARKDILDKFAIFRSINTSVYQFAKLLVTNLKLLTTMDILLYWMYCKRRFGFFQCRSRYWMPGKRHWQKVSTFALIQFPEKLTIWILEHLPFAIKESYFIFNGNFYKEHERKAMGPPFQPVFPNVFMVNFEKYRLQTCPPTRKLHFHPWWWWWWWWWCFCFSYFSCTK